MPVKSNREYRSIVLPFSVNSPQKRIETEYYVDGYATTFDDPYVLYSFDGIDVYEKIDRHALDDADLSDVIMQYDHEGRVLARNSNGSLGIEATDKGLFIFADLSGSDAARSMHEDISAGLVTKMSWAFSIGEEDYDKETRTRTIKKVRKVYDVSAVSVPANDGTEISARSFAQGRLDAEAQELREAEEHRTRINLLLEVST